MKRTLLAAVLTLCFVLPALAQPVAPPCRPCAGILTEDPAAVASALAETPALGEEARLYVAWEADLDADPAAGAALAEAGASPWLRLVFESPAPIGEHLTELDAELRRAVELLRKAEGIEHFQVIWKPATASAEPALITDYAFFLKRAAVALSGARGSARIITQPLPPDRATLELLYGEEVAAYIDGIALEAAPSDALEAAIAALGELDPGRPVVVQGDAFPAVPTESLALAAEGSRQGAAITFFDLASPSAADLAPLVLLANEFQGDLSFDPYSIPEGGGDAWTFVRGEDLSLRILARADEGADELVLRLSDSQLRRPARLRLEGGEAESLFGLSTSAAGIELIVDNPDPVTLISFDRATAAELEGIEERVNVESERTMPVEEILRRLQTFEDAQARKIERYTATNTTHLRFQASAGAAGTFEATFAGDFFFQRGEGYDWAWQEFYVNGVKWRGETLPEIPLIQPEKAAAMPLTIELSKRYSYQLRGTDTVRGRDCWVIDFRPVAEDAGEEGNLFRGTVWVDREIYARVRTRGVQLGLEGDVLSNEETVDFSPVDRMGQSAPWTPESYFLPLTTVAQQLFSVLNTSVAVEREILLSAVEIEPESFDARRETVLASAATMVRDTEEGMKYLVADEDGGGRVVKEGFDTSKLFVVGGLFYDESLDFPLPLGGVDYFNFDFRKTGTQLNVFFAGALLTVDWADPSLAGSRFDIGADAFALAISGTDQIFRDGVEVPGEEIESRGGNVSLFLGHPLGAFGRARLEYEATIRQYSTSDDTADDFVLPSDHVDHSLDLDLRYDRFGFRLAVNGAYHTRSEWEAWGLPGNTEFDPEQEDYLKWGATLSKNWHLEKFRRFAAEVEYRGGQDLDRFSKYGFGQFSDTRVAGYRSDRVRAEEVWAAHLRYGLLLGDVFRIEGVADAAWATDESAALDNELLGGVGVAGEFIGPWQTLIRMDVGVPVEGPDDGFTAFIAVLKLFK